MTDTNPTGGRFRAAEVVKLCDAWLAAVDDYLLRERNRAIQNYRRQPFWARVLRRPLSSVELDELAEREFMNNIWDHAHFTACWYRDKEAHVHRIRALAEHPPADGHVFLGLADHALLLGRPNV